MSAALDKEQTAALLKSGGPAAAYKAISKVLTEPASAPKSRLEIEFLSSGEAQGFGIGDNHVLREGNSVAIPKRSLVQAFCVARQILYKYRGQDDADKNDDEAMAATAVLLLMHPDHTTAANTRKRVIRSRLKNSRDPRSVDAIVGGELHFLDSILTSYLHKHTKSYTLWNHRLWLLSESKKGDQVSKEEVLRHFRDVVMVAAVRHPRNYYAWEHARWLVSRYRAATTGSSAEMDGDILTAVRDWCYQHHTDTSGWSFLLFLFFPLIEAAASSSPPAPLTPFIGETIAEVERLASSLHWTGEAVWVFLWTVVVFISKHCQKNEDDAARFHQTAKTLQGLVDPASQDWAVLQHAMDWCTEFQKT